MSEAAPRSPASIKLVPEEVSAKEWKNEVSSEDHDYGNTSLSDALRYSIERMPAAHALLLMMNIQEQMACGPPLGIFAVYHICTFNMGSRLEDSIGVTDESVLTGLWFKDKKTIF